jgi:hypothetical protein
LGRRFDYVRKIQTAHGLGILRGARVELQPKDSTFSLS